MQRYISSSTGRNVPGFCCICVEQVEEPLAAAHLLVEGRDQRARRPGALAAPGRVQHDVVEAGAKRIVRRAELLHRHAGCRAPPARTRAPRAPRARASSPGSGLRQRVAQPRQQLEQRRGGRGERRGADASNSPAHPATAAATRRKRPPRPARSGTASGGTARAGGAAAASPPGAGRMIVRSLSSGSANGLSLMIASLARPLSRGSPRAPIAGSGNRPTRGSRTRRRPASAASADCCGPVRNSDAPA